MINYNHKLHDEFIQQILDTRGRFGIPKSEYKERHHIIPECMGGQTIEENLIDLYPQEHYDAHKLLFEENPNNWGLACAWHNFHIRKASPNTPEIEVDRDEYARSREQFAKLASINNSIQRKIWWDEHPEEHEKMSARVSGEGNPMYGKKGLLNPFGGKKHSEEAKEKMRKNHWSKTGSYSPAGRVVTSETRQKISNTLSDGRLAGDKNPMYGKNAYANKTPEEMRIIGEKISKANSGANNANAISVQCIETGMIFDTCKDAASWCSDGNLSTSSSHKIVQCCKGEKNTYKGYHWQYYIKEDK